ncbi:hypothetical protein EG328_004772 [Venturia inaequalis]|uniref:Uncharacterized protein n=1 Tax=Venturia inaequalis TaxID=5025 RepID=A0A8H3Z5H3_VENIN|nr:hypothetical protein EG328_004772 [Venturia inaequalis]RDI87197.1 hypothetical protein Vi05172_g2651 [Venturia inaequalis]
MTWRLLSRASMQKITHGKNLTKTPALGVLWDEEANEGKDFEPGTLAELLCYGSVHFEQDRPEIDYVKAPNSDLVMKEKIIQSQVLMVLKRRRGCRNDEQETKYA